MAPESIDTDPTSLPHAFRGYNRRATEELFRRIAWDYAVLSGEHKKLKKTAGEQVLPPPPPPVEAVPAPTSEPQPAPAQSQRALFDEEAHSLLAAAHRAAREMRESTRLECEQALKKANHRAARIEREAVRAAAASRGVLDAALEMRATLHDALTRLEPGSPLLTVTDANGSRTKAEQ